MLLVTHQSVTCSAVFDQFEPLREIVGHLKTLGSPHDAVPLYH